MLSRSFRVDAEAIARDVRSELGLDPLARLDPMRLAGSLGIEVVPLSELREAKPGARSHFLVTEASAFSALTVFEGPKRLIVHNDSHLLPRQRNNVSHELSHGLLMHPPTPPLDARGLRDHDAALEEEAGWLGAVLLVPEVAALDIARLGLSNAEAAEKYGVSEPLVRWRMNMTAARKRVA